MKLTLSMAEIGAIIYALESVYERDSPEIQYIAQHLYEVVFNNCTDFDFYRSWCEEFHLSDEI